MNLILLFHNDFVGRTGLARIEGRRQVHVREVLRAKVGDSLCVGLAGGGIGEGKITQMDGEALEIEVKLVRHPPRPLPVTLVLALPRPKVMRRVIASVTAFGVKRIIMVNAVRVEKSYWKSPFLEKDELDKWIIAGLEQARDTIFPEIILRPLFKPFVEDELPGIIEGSLPLVAHPASGDACPCNVHQRVTLAVGPEGGFIPYEIDKLVAGGFRPVNMGERILPVATAIPALLARLSAL